MIASVNCAELLIAATVCSLLLLHFFCSKGHYRNWPFIGMLPYCFPIFISIFDRLIDILQCANWTFQYKGPWFCNRDMIITCDTANVYHILSSNFSNYPKGSDTKLQFEPYGLFLFSLDFEEWRSHRKITHEFLNCEVMQHMTPKVNLEILEKGLIPVLDDSCVRGLVLDLQDVIQRFMLDATMMIATGYSHGSLSIGSPEDTVLKAMHDVNRGIFMRHVLPERFWKLQRWLGVGPEKKMSEAWKLLDNFASKQIEKRKEHKNASNNSDYAEFNAVNFFPVPFELMVDVIKGLLFAGTDTTGSALAWFFMLVLENPAIENRIREEIEANLSANKYEKRLLADPSELNKLVYLHAALLESLRLYTPVPFQSRTCIKQDILPSGHHVKSGMRVIISPFAMGRMKSTWGEDYLQFRPERWIADKGRIIPIPSNKFSAFSSGPRICPGKQLSLIRLKAAAATIIHNYDVHLVKNHTITPATAIMLNMKYGLKATITKRTV